MEKSANEYLMEEINMRKYSEWQSPPITYWGPSSNNQEAKITYKYAFDGKVTYARARIPLAAFNFGASSGGSSSAWASKDGKNWERLLDNPYPANIDSYKTYEEVLPPSLLGGSELYVQVRMEVFGSPNSSYTLAQFSRSSTEAAKDVYFIDVEYSKASAFVGGNEKPKEVTDEGLLAHFPFDGNAQDYSENHLHGKVYAAKLTKDRFGVENKAYQFDGVDDYIKVNHHQSLNQLPLSVSLWLKSEGNQKESGIISKYYAAAWNGWQLMEFDGHLVPWYLRSYRPKNVIIGKYGESKSFETSFTQNIWNHVVCVFSKSGGEIYLNDKLADSKAWTGQPSAPTSQYPLYFGKYSGVSNGFFRGKIDDVRIYNRALTELEIVSLYEAEFSNRGAPDMPEPGEVPGGFVNYITLLGEVNGKVQKAEVELAELMKEGEEKVENIRDLELELSNVNQELARVEGDLKSCEEEGDRTRAEIKEVEKTVLSRELEIIGLEGQVDGVQARLDAAQCEYLKVEERLEFLKEEMSGYADKLKTAHTPGWHYVPGYGWLWTSPKHYPQVYSNTRNGWLYYEAGTSEPWLYYDYNLEQWEEWFVDPGFFSLNN